MPERPISRQESIDRLQTEYFDVLVVGGGIYGVMVARAAVRQGLKVGLIEQKDFGHATTANSQRIVHGGLRYLQHGDFSRMRESIASRRRLLKTAPHLVRPLKVVVPTYRHARRSRTAFKAALALNDAIGRDRNRGLPASHRIPRSGTVSRRACAQLIPGIENNAITGGAVWFDAVAHTERLTLELALDAADKGAVIANYLRAARYDVSKNEVIAVRAVDTLLDDELEIRARMVVETTGPWQSPSHGMSRHGFAFRPTVLALNVALKRRMFGEYAVGLYSRELARDLFFIPWINSTLAGTMYYDEPPQSADRRPTLNQVQRLLDAINSTYPPADIGLDDVAYVQWGYLPAKADLGARTAAHRLADRPAISRPLDISNLISVVGVKFTTAIQVADRVVASLVYDLGKQYVPVPEEQLRVEIGESEIASVDSVESGFEAALTDYARRTARTEMVQTLGDFLARRTNLTAFGHPGREIVGISARALADALAWSEARTRREIESVEALFPTFTQEEHAVASQEQR